MKYLILFLLFSCTEKRDPKAVLKDYVDYRFSMGQKKKWLLDHSTNPIRQLIESMDEDSFAQYTSVGHLQKRKFKINLSDCSPDKCFFTYTIKYKDKKNAFSIETKKTAILLKGTDQRWRVSETSDIKTHMGTKKEIVP